MKRISFHAGRNRSDDLLHIETDGCVVNIRVGLTDNEGREVTRVDILPDGDTRGGDGNGRYWYRDGARVIRRHEGELGRYITEREHGLTQWVRQSRERLTWLLERGLFECNEDSLRAQLGIILGEQERALAMLADPDADERVASPYDNLVGIMSGLSARWQHLAHQADGDDETWERAEAATYRDCAADLTAALTEARRP